MTTSTWRVSLVRRLAALVVAVAAQAIAVAVVVGGPRESIGFDLRLPVLVLTIGCLVTLAQWRRMVVIGRDELVVRTLARTRRVPWPAVASVRPRTGRITIREHNGRGFTLRTGVDTDDVADAIEATLATPRRDPAVRADADAVTYAADLVQAGTAGRAGEPVTVATPWLVLNGTTGVAFLAVKGYESNPALMAGLLGLGGMVFLATLGGCLVQWLRSR